MEKVEGKKVSEREKAEANFMKTLKAQNEIDGAIFGQ